MMAQLRGALLVFCVVLIAVQYSDARTFNLGVLIPWTVDWELGQYMGAAVGVALKEVESRNLLPGHTIEWQWKDTKCQPLAGIQAALDLADDNVLDAYIGGGCSSVCEPVALTAAARNLTFVSFGCNSHELSDKTTFPTFTRSVGTWLSLAPMVDALLDEFSWHRLAILNTHDHIMQETADALKLLIELRNTENNEKKVIEKAIGSAHDDSGVLVHAELENQRDALRAMKDQARVFVLLMSDNDIHTALLSAYDEGMMNGEYVFLAFEASLGERNSPDYRPVRSAYVYQGLISSNLRKPTSVEWDTFAQDVIDEFQSESKFAGHAKLASDAAVSEVDVHAGMLYDAVLMWAYGTNLSLEAGGNGNNGLDITNRIISDVDFEGISGRVLVSAQGNRKADYTLAIAQGDQWADLLRWDAVGEQLQKLYMAPTEETIKLPHNWEGIYWSANVTTVPVGRPLCGWDNEICKGLSAGEKAGIAVPVLLILICAVTCIIGYKVYKLKKFEDELRDTSLWKVNWSELTQNRLSEQIIGTLTPSLTSRRSESKRLALQPSKSNYTKATPKSEEWMQESTSGADSLNTWASSRATLKTRKTYGGLTKDQQANLPDVADYKGRTVVIKRVNKASVSIEGRDVLIDIKTMREIKHENLNAFVGACSDSPNVAIFWDYARKGSIQDVIKNTAVNLNWDFRLSIANDVARGMAYLHSTVIGYHGNLNSHNCVINSRWVCKVTDFGMRVFKHGSSRSIPCNTLRQTELLWTAPEHLCQLDVAGGAPAHLRRRSGDNPGSQKGDIYSYGIILQELILKDGPFCTRMPEMDPIAIVEQVSKGTTPPFRPILPQGSCGESWRGLVEDCWAQNPFSRPDFQRIKDMLKELNGGVSIDVIENIIKMMEQHTEHLEEMFAVKSNDATREKEKVVTLLNNLIPKSIAEQLGRGDEVTPEHFECATVVMSDVIGFANIKSQSTPDQMVEILNNIAQSFHELTEKYDLTKVNSVVEQNILVSGVPQRNGDAHVAEVATMALDMVNAAASFKIRHLPGTSLQLRVGMHTGPVVACVVGLNTPIFYMYGDALDIVAGIHSNSMSLRILMSATSSTMLEKAGGFTMECRGVTNVKGYGEMATFWLLEKEGFKKVPDMFQATQ